MFDCSFYFVILSFVINMQLQIVLSFDNLLNNTHDEVTNIESYIIHKRLKRNRHHSKIYRLKEECITSHHTLGECILKRDCPTSRAIISLSNFCNMIDKSTGICCEKIRNGIPIPESEVTITTTTESNKNKDEIEYTPPPLTAADIFAVMTKISKSVNEDIFERVKNSSTISNKKCVENTLLKYDGSEDDGLFVGGVLANEGDNPQIAAIGWKSWNNNIDWECGGSLISSTFILTAAHCTSNRGEAPYIVRVGDLNLLDNNDTVSKDFNITGIWTHPEYLPNLMYHDIALIRVSPPVPFTKYMKPGCLWTESDIPLEIVTGMGYGTESFGGKRTNQLYQGKLTIISNEVCEKALGIRADIPNGIIDSQLCAKDPSGIADTCQGDSGAPLVFRTGSRSSTNQHLIGITSFGVSCASFFPGVYTRVSSYIDWIESIVWPEEIHRL